MTQLTDRQDRPAAENLSKLNKVLKAIYWIFVGLAGASLLFFVFAFCATGCGTSGNTALLTYSLYSLFGNLFQAGVFWVMWCFSRGFERIVAASEYQISQSQKGNKQ